MAVPVLLVLPPDAMPQTVDSLHVHAGEDTGDPSTGPRDRPPELTDAAAVSGRVVDGSTGEPLRGVVVRLHGAGSQDGWTGVTDDGGRYEIGRLPAGHFVISATKGAYVPADRAAKLVKPPREIRLERAQRRTGVDFRLVRGGVIAGRVTDAAGEPVAGVPVSALRRTSVNGRRRLLPEGVGRTDDLGQFRLFGLSGGEYYVSTHATPGVGLGEEDTSTGLMRTYFPGTPSLREAELLSVVAGEEVGAVSFALVPARAVQVTGTVFDSQGRPLGGGSVVLEDAGNVAGSSFGSSIGPDGRFRIANLSPGDYVLHVNPDVSFNLPEADGESAAHPLSVGLDDISGVMIVTSPPTTVTGQVVFESAPPEGLKPSHLRFRAAIGGDSALIGPSPIGVREDWTFETRLSGPSFVIQPAQLPPGWGIEAVLLGGVDVTTDGIALAGRERVDGIQLVLSARMASVSGQVTDARRRLVRSGTVLIFADNLGPRQVLSTPLSERGDYVVRHVPAGQYLAVAVDRFDAEQMAEGDYLERLRDRATPFAIKDGEQRRLDLELVRAP